jgi:hypothetical protein
MNSLGSQSPDAHSLAGMMKTSTCALHVTDTEPCCQISTCVLHVTDRRRAELGSKRGDAVTESVLWGVMDIYRTREDSDFGFFLRFIYSHTRTHIHHTRPHSVPPQVSQPRRFAPSVSRIASHVYANTIRSISQSIMCTCDATPSLS